MQKIATYRNRVDCDPRLPLSMVASRMAATGQITDITAPKCTLGCSVSGIECSPRQVGLHVFHLPQNALPPTVHGVVILPGLVQFAQDQALFKQSLKVKVLDDGGAKGSLRLLLRRLLDNLHLKQSNAVKERADVNLGAKSTVVV